MQVTQTLSPGLLGHIGGTPASDAGGRTSGRAASGGGAGAVQAWVHEPSTHPSRDCNGSTPPGKLRTQLFVHAGASTGQFCKHWSSVRHAGLVVQRWSGPQQLWPRHTSQRSAPGAIGQIGGAASGVGGGGMTGPHTPPQVPSTQTASLPNSA
jgi:hypothetical protein